MSKYESGDVVTYHFIIKQVNGDKIIQAWTDDKELARFYMDFHKSKYLTMKSVTNTIEEIIKITEENIYDEISVFNIMTRNRSRKKHDDEYIEIAIPATEIEMRFVRDEINTCMSTSINYSMINDAIPYLRGKYKEALSNVFLPQVIKDTMYSRDFENRFITSIYYDELMVLLRSFPDMFG